MPNEMTLEYALIILNQCNTDDRIKIDRGELKEAVKVVHKEMRYRIPRKPVPSEHGGWISCCPACGRSIPTAPCNKYIYCEYCGQAIDWSDYV